MQDLEKLVSYDKQKLLVCELVERDHITNGNLFRSVDDEFIIGRPAVVYAVFSSLFRNIDQ